MVELALELLDAVLETILSGRLLGLGKRRGFVASRKNEIKSDFAAVAFSGALPNLKNNI